MVVAHAAEECKIDSRRGAYDHFDAAERQRAAAAGKVARASSAWPKYSRGAIKSTIVANWRDEILQSASDDPKRSRYETLCLSVTGVSRRVNDLLCRASFGRRIQDALTT